MPSRRDTKRVTDLPAPPAERLHDVVVPGNGLHARRLVGNLHLNSRVGRPELRERAALLAVGPEVEVGGIAYLHKVGAVGGLQAFLEARVVGVPDAGK
jgi:hypothetical protein